VAILVLLALVVRRRRPAAADEPSTPDIRVRAPPTEDGPTGESAEGHLLFVPTTHGYELVERAGDVPPVLSELDGQRLGLDGRFVVTKIVESPLPADRRECAYLERA
jgi:hypothetical protein